jgi:hypothetical protein
MTFTASQDEPVNSRNTSHEKIPIQPTALSYAILPLFFLLVVLLPLCSRYLGTLGSFQGKKSPFLPIKTYKPSTLHKKVKDSTLALIQIDSSTNLFSRDVLPKATNNFSNSIHFMGYSVFSKKIMGYSARVTNRKPHSLGADRIGK